MNVSALLEDHTIDVTDYLMIIIMINTRHLTS